TRRGPNLFVPSAASATALLPTTADGVHLVTGPFDVPPTPTIDLAQRFATVAFEHPATRLGGAELLERTDRLAAIGAAATLLGLMVRSLEMTLEYVNTRSAFQPPIRPFPPLQ